MLFWLLKDLVDRDVIPRSEADRVLKTIRETTDRKRIRQVRLVDGFTDGLDTTPYWNTDYWAAKFKDRETS
jgi:hypothetical protein